MITKFVLTSNGEGGLNLVAGGENVGAIYPDITGMYEFFQIVDVDTDNDTLKVRYTPIDLRKRMTTKQAVEEMLKWNTGRHMLDSGGYGNRGWERLQGVDLLARPEAVLDEYGYTQDLYHYLIERVYFCQEAQDHFDKVDADNPDLSYTEILKKLYDTDVIIHNCSGLTANEENTLSQDFIWHSVEVKLPTWDDYVTMTIIQSHNGADIRGGYSKPFFFMTEYENILLDINRANVYCDTCHTNWYSDDGANTWESDDDGACDWTRNWSGDNYFCACGGVIKA